MDRHLHAMATRAVHAGREDLTGLGVHAAPIDLSTTYPVQGLDGAGAQLDAFASGEIPDGSPIYARLHNPTVGRFEDAIANLEGADAAVAFASGMGAITATLMSLPMETRHVVGVRPLYGGTDHLLESGVLGIEVTWTSPEGVAAAIRSDTGMVLLETPRNPTVGLVDIAAVVAQADEHGVPVLVDNTFATPIVQRPIACGATLVVHSATKFLGGHGDAMGGVVACDEAWARLIRQLRVATGAVLHPFGAYHLHRGLSTLAVRMRAMQSSASELAGRLAVHPAIERVHHPSVEGCDPAGLVGTQMTGPGSIIAIELAGGYDAARSLLGGLQLCTHAVSLGSTDTLVQHPASLTHRVMSEGSRDACGIGAGLVRISVGLEDVDDLWLDLEHGLGAASRSRISRSASATATNGNGVRRARVVARPD